MSRIVFYEADQDNKIYNISHKYVGQKQYTMQLADIITKLNVVSSQAPELINKSAITHITIGSNVSAIGPSCFVGCTNLKDVKTHNKLKVIDRQAFYGCTNLTSFGAFCIQPIPKVNVIQQSAFAETGLVNISISLSGTATATFISPYAFANCKSLKSVTNVGSNYLADFEFAGCTALTSVKMPNSHSFSGEYSFKDCTALSKIEIPANTFKLNDGLFYGCASLTSVVFNEPSQLKFEESIGNLVFSGTGLTSLTLPTSITSYTQIASYAFADMPYLQEIHFNGMPSAAIATTYQEQTVDYETGYIYSSEKALKDYGVFKSNSSAYKYNKYVKYKSEDEIKKYVNKCIQTGIPVIVIRGNLDGGCGPCREVAEYVIATKKFLNWVKSDRNKYVIASTSYIKIPGLPYNSGKYPFLDLYWKEKKDDGTSIEHKYNTSDMEDVFIKTRNSPPDDLINLIEKKFAAYQGSSAEVSYVISGDLIGSHCFGLNHNVLLYGNDNPSSPIKYEDDGTGGIPSIIYNQTIQVDHITVDDFRYGQWYFNARELKAFADANSIPVFFEFGSKNCGPCDDFAAKVFNNSNFQSLLKSKQILLCKVTSSADFATGEEYFIANEWIRVPLRPEGLMPILGIYWKKKDGGLDSNGNRIDSEYLAVAHYNAEGEDKYPGWCPLLHDLASTMSWLNQRFLASGIDAAYSPNPSHNLPSIIDKTGSGNYPRYKMYNNVQNDTYGRYFPVAHLSPPKAYDVFTISVNNEYQALTQYIIDGTLYADAIPPQGTYQYFTTLSTASYDSMYDLSGIIFKSEAGGNETFYKTMSFPYGSKTKLQLLQELGIANSDGSLIPNASQRSTFYDDAYIVDTSTLPPSVRVNVDFFDNPSQGWYNNKTECYIANGIDNDGRKLTRLQMTVSSDVEAVDDGDGFYSVQPIGLEYVTTAAFYSIDFNQRRIAWLSVFNNI